MRFRTVFLVLLVCTAANTTARSTDKNAAPAPVVAPPGYTLVWSDEFEGDKLNLEEWVYRTDSKHWSTQKPENVVVADGKLILNLRKENANGKQYTGAGIISKKTFKYGYYEARLKLPKGKGWHSTFWLQMHDGSGGTDPRLAAQEVDIMESDSIHPAGYSISLHQWLPKHSMLGFRRHTTPDLSADFHVFGCEFQPTLARFFFNGRLMNAVDVSRLTASDQHVWLTSIASHLGKTDSVDDTKLPTQFVVDWVRVFERTD